MAFVVWLHIVAAALWVGPQVFLFVAFAPAMQRIADQRLRAEVTRVMTRRFGMLAAIAMVVLVITGLVMVGERLYDWSVLVTTSFGQMLLLKGLLVLAVLGLTVYHAFELAPRVAAMALSVGPGEASLRRRSLLVNSANLALSLAVLLLGVFLRYV